MTIDTKTPDALISSAGFSSCSNSDLSSIDGLWCIASDNNINTETFSSFPTPSDNPTTGANLQTFNTSVRRTIGSGSTDPIARIELWESGVLVTAGSDTSITSDTGQTLALLWDATSLSGADGSNVEIKVITTKSGGSPAKRSAVDVGFVEWVADVTATTSNSAVIASTLPSLSATITTSYTMPVRSANIASTMPSLDSSVNSNQTVPVYDNGIASTLPSLNSSVIATYTLAGNDSLLASTLPSLNASVSVNYTLPILNQLISSVLPSLSSSASATQSVPEYNQEITGTMPSLESSISAQSLTPGNNSSTNLTLPSLFSAVSAEIIESKLNTITSQLPSLSTSILMAQEVSSFNVDTSSTLPFITSSSVGTNTTPISDSTGNSTFPSMGAIIEIYNGELIFYVGNGNSIEILVKSVITETANFDGRTVLVG